MMWFVCVVGAAESQRVGCSRCARPWRNRHAIHYVALHAGPSAAPRSRRCRRPSRMQPRWRAWHCCSTSTTSRRPRRPHRRACRSRRRCCATRASPSGTPTLAPPPLLPLLPRAAAPGRSTPQAPVRCWRLLLPSQALPEPPQAWRLRATRAPLTANMTSLTARSAAAAAQPLRCTHQALAQPPPQRRALLGLERCSPSCCLWLSWHYRRHPAVPAWRPATRAASLQCKQRCSRGGDSSSSCTWACSHQRRPALQAVVCSL